MSLASWKAIYYPVDAKDVPAEGALTHSLKKWEGLRPEVLKEHDLEMYDGALRSARGYLGIDSESCALCFHFLREHCGTCPLAKVRGGVPCDQAMSGEANSPYWAYCWEKKHDPEPMIAWLKKANDASR